MEQVREARGIWCGCPEDAVKTLERELTFAGQDKLTQEPPLLWHIVTSTRLLSVTLGEPRRQSFILALESRSLLKYCAWVRVICSGENVALRQNPPIAPRLAGPLNLDPHLLSSSSSSSSSPVIPLFFSRRGLSMRKSYLTAVLGLRLSAPTNALVNASAIDATNDGLQLSCSKTAGTCLESLHIRTSLPLLHRHQCTHK